MYQVIDKIIHYHRGRKILLNSLLLILLLFSTNSFADINVPIVFVSRNHQANGNINFPSAGLLPGMGPFSRFKVVGGKLLIRHANGSVETLVDSTTSFNGVTLIDVQQPCVHWEGNRILFAGIEHPDSNWRIYQINSDGTGFKKITTSNRIVNLTQFGPAANKFIKYNDIDPIYTPDNKIVFASTRYPTLSQFGINATNLYIVDSTGNNLFRITTERNGAEKPTIDPSSGKIIYARWLLNIDMPSNQTPSGLTRDIGNAIPGADIANIWQPIVIKQDGDAIELFSGDPRTRTGMFSYRPRITSNGRLLGIYSPDSSMTHTGSSTGIRYYNDGLSEVNNVIGVNPGTPLYIQSPPSYGTYMPPYATDPVELPDGTIMFSYATDVEDQDYGIYQINFNGTGLQQIIDLPVTLELNAEPLVSKTVPPILPIIGDYDTNSVPPTINPNSFYQGGVFRFDCVNIFSNAPVDVPIDDAPDLDLNLRIKFFLNFQRTDTMGRDEPILFHEMPVTFGGFIAFGDAPANVSMFEQIVDSNGNILVNSKGNIAHVAGLNYGVSGSGTKCVGCHPGHTRLELKPSITENSFTNVSTSADVIQSSFLSNGSDYKGENVVDRKARNTNLNVNWIAGNNTNNEFVELKWNVLIEPKELYLYNILPNPGNNTNIQVQDCEVFFYKDSNQVGHIASTGPLSSDGSLIPVDSNTVIKRLKVIIKSFTGTINNLNLPGLAEVETIARISFDNQVGIDPISNTPSSFSLSQNYPNPFNPVTRINFSVPKKTHVSLKVYDINGREISTLVEGSISAGNSSVIFNGSRFASGVYFYRIIAGDFTETKKMLLIK